MRPHVSGSSESEFQMEPHKLKFRKARSEIRRVLLEVWDPIGVRDVPQAQDEYDSYVGGIYRLLAEKAPDEKIVDYLYWVETDQMGLSEHDRAGLRSVVEALSAISI